MSLLENLQMVKTADCPKEIQTILDNNPHVTPTPFESKNDILRNKGLQEEVGFEKLNDGTYIVSMTCPMPGITKEMIEWWFWWHPQADERYRIWFPEEHFSIGYAKENTDYFHNDQVPPFQPNTHFPKERIGNHTMPLRIDFISPESFGYSTEQMERNDVALIVCGHIGIFKGMIMHTEMSHIFFQREDGLYLVSRFWLGQLLTNRLLKKLFVNEEMAKALAIHCCREYRNLAKLLQELYEQFGKTS